MDFPNPKAGPASFTADYTDILDYTDGDQAFCAYDRGYAFPPG